MSGGLPGVGRLGRIVPCHELPEPVCFASWQGVMEKRVKRGGRWGWVLRKRSACSRLQLGCFPRAGVFAALVDFFFFFLFHELF